MPDKLDEAYEKNMAVQKRDSSGSKVGSSSSPITVNGYQKSEVKSALQKCIRRGHEPEALYWASELLASGAQYDFWRRIFAITAEDVGLGDPDMPQRIAALNDMFRVCQEWNIPFMAVMLLCRAPKNREADDAAWMYEVRRKEGWKIPIPAVAVDGHTPTGRNRLYAIARANGETFDKTWGREFYYDAALLKGYVPVIDPNDPEQQEDRYRRALMAHPMYNLPYRTYELDECPEPRILSGGAGHGSVLASRTPDSIQFREKVNEGTGEIFPGVYEVLSFSDGKTVYEVNLTEETCTCPAYANGGGRACKHLFGVDRKVNAQF